MQLKIGFYGAGKVAFSLGKYFADNKLALSGYYSLHENSAMLASQFTNSKFYNSLNSFIKDSDIIFITTPDDIIEKSWQKIKNHNLEGKIIAHASGSLSSTLFSDSKNSGCYFYSIHPIFPFSDKFTCYKNLKGAYFSLEGDEKHFAFIKNTLESLGNKVIAINSSSKTLYHLSCVISSNLVLSLLNYSTTLLKALGLEEDDGLKALSPLIYANINSIIEKGFHSSLTGPVPRGDLDTISKHLKDMPNEFKDIYKLLSLNLLKLSKEKYTNNDYTKLEEVLRG